MKTYQRTLNILFLTTLMLKIGTAHAVLSELPPIKGGLWQIHSATISNPKNQQSQQTLLVCRPDGAAPSALASNRDTGCTVIDEKLNGNQYSVEMRCANGHTLSHMQAMTTYIGKSAQHSVMNTDYDPAFLGITTQTITTDGHYVSSCPTDMQIGDAKTTDGTLLHPGDVQLPDGTIKRASAS